MQQAKVMSQVQYAVAGKILDQQRSDGAAAVQLIQPTSGASRAGDQLVAAATGLGGTLHVQA